MRSIRLVIAILAALLAVNGGAIAFGQPPSPIPNNTMSASMTKWYSVQDYGAKGDGVSLNNASTSLGSATVSDSVHVFTAADIGKSICVQGADSGATLTITNVSSATPAVITFTYSSSITLFTIQFGAKVVISNVLGATGANGTRYLGTISGSGPYTAPLYSDQQIATPVAPGGTYTSGGTAILPIAFVSTVTGMSGGTPYHSVTTSSTPVIATSSATGTIGTNNKTAIANAYTAIAANTNGGVLYFPSGNYCMVGGSNITTPGVAIVNSNIGVVGSGIGVSTLTKMDEAGPIIGITAGSSNLSGNFVRDLTVQYGCLQTQRYALINTGLAVQGNSSYSVRMCNIKDVESTRCCLGINLLNNIIDSQVKGCYVHDTIADGISSYATVTPNMRLLITGNTVYNTGDDGISDNSYSGSSGANHGIVIANNSVLNSAAGGVASCGSDQTTISNNIIQRTFLAGVRVQGGFGFYKVTTTIVTGNNISGFGLGTAPSTSAAGGVVAGVLIQSDGTQNCDNVIVTNNEIGSDLGVNSMGTAIAVYSTNASLISCNNHLIANNKITGPFVAVSGIYHSAISNANGAAIFVNSGTNATIKGNSITQSYGEAIVMGSLNSKAACIEGNLIDQPNSSATGGYYAIDVQGCQVPVVQNNTVTGVGTLTGMVNIAPQQTAANTSLFNAAPFGNAVSISGKTETTGALTWSVVGAGTIQTKTSAPYIAYTTVSATTACLLNPGVHDVDVIIVMNSSAQPSAANQCFAVFGGNGSQSSYIAVDLYSYAIGTLTTASLVNGVALGGNVAASDTIEIIIVGNQVSVYDTHSGTRNLVNQQTVSAAYTGTYCGLAFATSAVGVASFAIR